MGTHMPNESHSVTCHPAEVTFTILVFTPAKLALDFSDPGMQGFMGRDDFIASQDQSG